MSGVELAGLVLGTFPLLVSALEAYQNGFQPLKDWFKFHAEFISFIHDIQRQGVIYEDNLKLLLTSVCDCDEEKAVLLEDPLGEAWYDEDFRRRLQEQLPGSKFEAYMDSIQDVKAVIDKLKKKLGIDDDGKISWLDDDREPGRIQWELHFKRIRFCLSRKKREALIDKFTRLNNDIQKIQGNTERLAKMQEKKRLGTKTKKTITSSFQKVQQHALSLHNAISKKWACGCTHAHNANLALDKRANGNTISYSKASVDEKQMPPPENRFMLLFYSQTNPWIPPADWRETEVHVEEKELENEEPRPPMHRAATTPAKGTVDQFADVKKKFQERDRRKTSHSTTSLPSLAGSSTPKSPLKSAFGSSSSLTLSPTNGSFNKQKKSVGFMMPRISDNIYHAPSLNSSLTTLVNVNSYEIMDLCSTIFVKDCRDDSCLGYIEDEESARKLSFLPPSEQYDPNTHDLVDLHTLLNDNRIRFTRKERLSVAVTLAYSLLQLHSTPWLGTGWSKHDISFLRVKAPASAKQAAILADRPYIKRKFAGMNRPRSPLPSPGLSDGGLSARRLCEKALLNFGVLLLELLFRQPIESLPQKDDYLDPHGMENEGTIISMAMDWLEAVEEECGSSYHDAVYRCVKGGWPSCKVDFADERLRNDFYAEVVAPLEEMLQQF